MVATRKTLSSKILKKLNTPRVKDVDIENDELTQQGSDSEKDSDEEQEQEHAKRQHYVSVPKSKIKGTTINLGEKYVGERVSRDEMFDMESTQSEDDDDDEDDDDEEEEEEEDSGDEIVGVPDFETEGIEEASDEDISSDNSNSDQEQNSASDAESDEEEDEDELFKRNQLSKILKQEKEQILTRLSSTAKSDALRGYTILRQGTLFDKILDSRIKFQKAVVSSNGLPINLESLESNSTDKTQELLTSVEEKLYNLIDKLTQLRKVQLEKENLIKEKINIQPKKRTLDEYLRSNNEIDEIENPIRKAIVSKWSNRVQSASGLGTLNQGKFKVINQSIWSQVSNQFDDLDRMVKKTKVNRRGITPIGYNDAKLESDGEEESEGQLSNIDKSLQTNEYIFDDDDFYRLLLNDMINKKLDQKQANSPAILMLSKNKLQKNYDRMATKGRKLKYTIQDPLVQFEMPKGDRYLWGDEQIDELFAGLMGMKIKMDDNDSDDDEENASDADIETFKESGVKLFG
ncbi:rRNA-processing protein [Martiniozyma asiatica (nom. inval.)]|nr:rRNA-processing protein [Martiniozyma asiatica]